MAKEIKKIGDILIKRNVKCFIIYLETNGPFEPLLVLADLLKLILVISELPVSGVLGTGTST